MENQTKLPKGFHLRAGTMEDLPAALELFNQTSKKMIGSEEFTLVNLENDWTTPGFNQETDQKVILSPEGKQVAYGEVWAVSQPPVHPWVWGRVHPDFEGLGLGSYLLEWAEQRVQQVVEETPDEARVSFYAGIWDHYKPGNDLLTGYGMNLIRNSYQMRIEMNEAPPQPKWPEGIQVRTFRPEDAEAVYRADEEAFQDHFGHLDEDFETGFARFKHRFSSDPDFDPEIWFLAMDGDEIAGISLCRKKSWEDENMGWVSVLAVRRPWRKQGLGLALLHHSFATFWERGKQRVGLGVDAENLTGALRLYEKAGMHVHRKFNLYEKEIRAGKELAVMGLPS